MEIKGNVYCFFEQSRVFKNAFKEQGYHAEDFDIQNNFNETDHVTDLFGEIEKAFDGNESLFDNITSDDLILAFFPCIYFCENNQLYFTGRHHNLRNKSMDFIERNTIERANNRNYLYVLLLKLFNICTNKGLRLIVENPYATQHYLHENFPYKPKVIDRDRTRRGDYFTKPTQYFFHNCEPTDGCTFQRAKEHKQVRNSKSGIKAGICSEERSLISPNYARNFICDWVIGKEQVNSQRSLFEDPSVWESLEEGFA